MFPFSPQGLWIFTPVVQAHLLNHQVLEPAPYIPQPLSSDFSVSPKSFLSFQNFAFQFSLPSLRIQEVITHVKLLHNMGDFPVFPFSVQNVPFCFKFRLQNDCQHFWYVQVETFADFLTLPPVVSYKMQ